MAVSANMGVVYAALKTEGVRIGVFPFIVQIRDFDTHKLLDGVEVGDIGPKLGYNSKDNGFMKFTNFRIPKKNILSKFFEIDDQGMIMVKSNPKIIYASMMNVRKFLLAYSSIFLARATAIAVRYSFLRKQFKNSQGEEIHVMNYQTQKNKLFDLLAKAYVMHGSFKMIESKIDLLYQQIAQGNFKNLQEIHIILSGSKSFYTWWCLNGLITCISSCGGHGFQDYSGIPDIFKSFFPNIILEGENTVLALQVGKYLIKCQKYIQ